MTRLIVSLLVGFFALGSDAFATVSARNGVSITTASTINGRTPNSAINGQTIASGGGSPALIASVATGGTINGVTSSAIDTTGANFFIATVSWYATVNNMQLAQFSDSKGNTWSELTVAGIPGTTTTANRIFYCVPTSVGTGHTFTASRNDTYPAIAVMAFSNMSATPFDQQNQNEAAATTTIQPGSITATQANSVLFSSVSWEVNATTVSINSSFTGLVQASPVTGDSLGVGLAYRIDTSASATNPTWTKSGSSAHMSSSIAAFDY
jgi:hypothetical protein